MESYLLDIQRCSTHDGPGIRTTVFFKGCPLRCKWCHNPESQDFKRQLSFVVSKCTQCGQCEKVCPNGVHRVYRDPAIHKIHDSRHQIDYEKCNKCEACVKACPNNALEMKGKKFDVDEVMKIIMQDMAYYKKSNGGVTLSGGEVLSHPQAAVELLKACKKKRIHTCIETSGVGSIEALGAIVEHVDLVLYDYKHTNEALHKAYIGVTNKHVIESLNYLQEKGKRVILRCPIIPEVNDTKEHFEGIAYIVSKHSIIEGVEILPYHNMGTSKAKSIGEKQEVFRTPTKDEVSEWVSYCKELGINMLEIS